MIPLLIILCVATCLGYVAARQARVNGWITRYLLALFANSVAVTLPLLVVTPQSAIYSFFYIAALVPLLVTMFVLGATWLWRMGVEDIFFVSIAAAGVALFGMMALWSRAIANWTLGVPWQIQLLIVQFVVLSLAGFCALAAASSLGPDYEKVARVLGSMWIIQAIEKAIFVSGFAYYWEQWFSLSRWLPQAVVIIGMAGLVSKLKSIQFQTQVRQEIARVK